MSEKKATGLELLREPFKGDAISKKPALMRWMTDEVRNKEVKVVHCNICGNRHHPKAAHLDYVGHAALTHRLLDCDPKWNWEPLSRNEDGSPKFDQNGGLWINLTVCGVTRLGYGDAEGKKGGNAVKEAIGDALRNAGMRFGAALDLWHKGDLNASDGSDEPPVIEPKQEPKPQVKQEQKPDPAALFDYLKDSLFATEDLEGWKTTQNHNLVNLKNADKAKFDNLMDLGKKRAGTLAQAPAKNDLEDVPF